MKKKKKKSKNIAESAWTFNKPTPEEEKENDPDHGLELQQLEEKFTKQTKTKNF